MRSNAVSRTRRSSATKRTKPSKAVTVIALVCSLAAPACLVGPDYERPAVPMNRAWGPGDDARFAAHKATERAWWSTFDDRALDRLIGLAHAQNLSLQVAALRILEARAELGVATGELLPRNVRPIAGASVTGLSERVANVAFLPKRSYGLFQVGFDALWEPDFWGKYRRGMMAADAAWGASVADYDAAVVSISADVARAYIVFRTFEVLIDLALRNMKLQEEALAIADSRYRNGAASYLDVAQATSQLETTRSSIPQLEVGVQQTENALSTLLGRPTGFVHALLEGDHDIPRPPAEVAVGVPADLLRRRPDIRAAELRAIAQCNQVGVAQAELLPQLSLFGAIGTQASAVKNLFASGSFAYDAGVGLFIPFLRYPQILNNIHVEDFRYRALLVDYVSTVLRAAQEVEDEMIGYLKRRDASASQERAVASAETAVDVAFTQYREGAIDFQRVIDTQRVLLEAEDRLTELRSSAATDLVALYKALGGGWEVRLARASTSNRR